MLRILVLTVFSVVFLNAQDFPIERKVNLEISNYTTTILEFPFKIVDKKIDRFKIVKYKTEKELSEKKEDEEVSVPKITTKKTKIVNGKKIVVSEPSSAIAKKIMPTKKPVVINSSKDGNIIELTPNMTGSFKIIVWGYKYYPIMLNINIVENSNEIDDYFNFIDYKTPKNEVVKFESQKHEKVIIELLRTAYKNLEKKGYENILQNQITEDEKGYQIKLLNTLEGKKYKVSTYEYLNKLDEAIKLENEMFQKSNSYAVSIEKLSKILESNEKTRFFIVSKR